MRDPGFHLDVPEVDYHADRSTLSVSGAKVLLQAPALFKWQQDHPVYKAVFDFGSAAHAKVLGVGAELVVHEYDTAKVKSPKSTNAWKAQQAEVRETDGVLLLPEEHQTVVDMADALTNHPFAVALLEGGDAEVSAYAPDEPTGIMRRCRFDYLRRGDVGTDYKSTISAHPDAFVKQCVNYGYDSQAAWYSDLSADLGEPLTAFAFIAQEKVPPYLVEVYELPPELLERGRRRNRRALERFRDCIETGLWPGYTGQPYTTLTAPYWALREEDLA